MGANYNWSDFVKSYKNLVQRVQGRHGVNHVSTKFDFDLDDVLHFLNNQNSKNTRTLLVKVCQFISDIIMPN